MALTVNGKNSEYELIKSKLDFIVPTVANISTVTISAEAKLDSVTTTIDAIWVEVQPGE